MNFSEQDLEKFWGRVTKMGNEGCWFWDVRNPVVQGGTFAAQGKTMGVHVASFLMHGGILTPEKPWVLHSCNKRACVNPAHLRAGTRRENYDDMSEHYKQKRKWKSQSREILQNLCFVIRCLNSMKND